MASQYNVDIPFSASQEQQGFKLIELPPDLLALLESDSPPTWVLSDCKTQLSLLIDCCRLTITSSVPDANANVPAYALLNTGTKAYQIRQKSTSSPLMIIQPSSTGPTETDDAAAFIPQPSLCSIAKIEDTIELILQEPDGPTKAPPKVNKWHEKFAKSRVEKKSWRARNEGLCA